MARKRIQSATDQRPFIMVYQDFLESELLGTHEKLLFIVLKKFANSKNQCFPSLKKIADVTGMSKRKVQDTLKELEQKNVIAIEGRNRTDGGYSSNLYTLYDFKELWNAGSSDEVAAVVDEYEDKRIIDLLESKGYVVTKEKELECEPTKAHTQALELNQYDMVNTTTNSKKSQYAERYTIEQIRQLYDYEYLIQDNYIRNEDVETVISVLYDALNTTKSSIRVDGEDKPAMIVISKLMKLDMENIKYAIGKYHEQTERIKNVNAYLLTILYHAKEQSYLDLMNQGHTNGDF
ncbi:MAG: helix-turn-helix domain-containing protein [Negativicutes bacterium]|nr:helix-turn-helix domain-containing protein [Negativicutes bacterium]